MTWAKMLVFRSGKNVPHHTHTQNQDRKCSVSCDFIYEMTLKEHESLSTSTSTSSFLNAHKIRKVIYDYVTSSLN